LKKCKLGKDLKGHQQSVTEKEYISKTNMYAVVNAVSTFHCFIPVLIYPHLSLLHCKKGNKY